MPRLCQQAEAVRMERMAFFKRGMGSGSSVCSGWPAFARTLRLSPLNSCMKAVADSWWGEVARPMLELCRAEKGRPGEIASSKVVPSLAIAAARLLPRLRPMVQVARARCATQKATVRGYQTECCATFAKLGPDMESAQPATPAQSMLPEVSLMTWHASALASDALARAALAVADGVSARA
mmetsp:Transcript_56180/g.162802  ORF Transcript_56180/g.162802 Transcript_56180/m.162802 type:complete len:181 (-) Transcript_56180:75-617(-)